MCDSHIPRLERARRLVEELTCVVDALVELLRSLTRMVTTLQALVLSVLVVVVAAIRALS